MTRPWHRWLIDPLVTACRTRALVAFGEACEFDAARDDVHRDRAVLAHVFWVRLALALSPRPTRELVLGPLPVLARKES